MMHAEEPTKVPTELLTDMPTEFLTDTTTELADGQAEKKHTGILQESQHAASRNVSDMQKDKPDNDITTATSAHPGVQDQGCSMQDFKSMHVPNQDHSQGLKHVDVCEHKTKQMATTNELAVDLMPYFLPTTVPYPLLSLQEQQDAEAMLQNQQAHMMNELQKLKSQMAWWQQLQRQQHASLKVSRTSATTTESTSA